MTKRQYLCLTSLEMYSGQSCILRFNLEYLPDSLLPSYPLETDPAKLVPKPKEKLPPAIKRESILSHENELGDLVLGHASMITAMQLSLDDNYIVTSDRDEHIRVSHYPDGFNIEAFCFGHTKC